MMKKQPTATQQKLIDSGAAARTLTTRYETSRYGSAARRETVKATICPTSATDTRFSRQGATPT